MQIFKGIALSTSEPPRDVLWMKPVEGGVALYAFAGYWKLLRIMDGHGTPSTDDDTPYNPGGGGKPDPNSVGSEEIIDGSVRLVDLNNEVTDKLDDTYVEDRESLYINGTKPV
jgi:hypothetical protein